MRVLIADGMHQKGIWMMEDANIEITEKSLSREELKQQLPEFDGIIVRSATKLDREILSLCPSLRFIGRGGVGLDNIDLEYAQEKGIEVFNTPVASSRSVAELVFAHILSISRGVHQSNREMPVREPSDFKQLKKRYSKGIELSGKTIGIIGLGRIGTESARIAIGLGMRVMCYDPQVSEKKIGIDINGQQVYTMIYSSPLQELLEKSDIISLHIPNQKTPVIGKDEIDKMKEGVIIINASRGGLVDELALIDGLNSGKILGAGLDVFDNEPEPDQNLLRNPGLSLSPHIGAATYEAQQKIAIELANRIIQINKKVAQSEI